MRSLELSLEEWRRLDEVCDDWAAWFCDRWAGRPGLEKQEIFNTSTGYWDASDLVDHWGERSRSMMIKNREVDAAVDSLFVDHRRMLQAWAWEQHYSRAVQRKVIMSARVAVTQAAVDEAKLALLPKLRQRAVM